MDKYEICNELSKLIANSDEPLEDLKTIFKTSIQLYRVYYNRTCANIELCNFVSGVLKN